MKNKYSPHPFSCIWKDNWYDLKKYLYLLYLKYLKNNFNLQDLKKYFDCLNGEIDSDVVKSLLYQLLRSKFKRSSKLVLCFEIHIKMTFSVDSFGWIKTFIDSYRVQSLDHFISRFYRGYVEYVGLNSKY